MSRFETIYSFRVLDEIGAGKTVYVVDRTKADQSTAICTANEMYAGELLQIINHDNSDNRYEFFIERGVKAE